MIHSSASYKRGGVSDASILPRWITLSRLSINDVVINPSRAIRIAGSKSSCHSNCPCLDRKLSAEDGVCVCLTLTFDVPVQSPVFHPIIDRA